jgi:hypothetical protein
LREKGFYGLPFALPPCNPEVLDYTQEDVGEALKGKPVDIAIDCMGTRSEASRSARAGAEGALRHGLSFWEGGAAGAARCNGGARSR